MQVDWTAITIGVGAVSAVVYLFILGVVLKSRGLQERSGRALALYATVSFLWIVLLVLGQLNWPAFLPEDLIARTPFYGILLLALLFLHLSRSFLRLEGTGLAWWALGAVLVAAVIALDGNLFVLPETLWTGDGWAIERQSLTLGLLILGWASFTAGATLLTVRVYRQTEQPLHRNRITYWTVALALTIAGQTLVFAGQEAIGSSLCLLGVVVAAYVIMTHRLPDVRQIERRVLSYLIITLLAVATYTGGFLVTQYLLFQTIPVYSTLAAGAVMALILAILFNPLLNLIQRLVARLVSGAGYDPGRALREYSISISNILDPERLSTVAVGIISEAMEIQRGALFLVHREAADDTEENRDGYFQLRGVKGMGAEDPTPGVLSVNSPVANCLRREHRPLTQYDIDLLPRFRNTLPGERAWLASLNMDVYVPIYAKGEWIGLLALGPKVSGDRYFDEDLILLSTLADQTSVALENARLFDDLKVRNEENEQLNKELANANLELERLDQAKSDFINVASHELRTPLTQVRGYTEILSDMSGDNSLTPDMANRMTAGISKATRRLEEIIDTMFIISKIDTQTLALDPSMTSVSTLVSTAVDTWTTALEERKQTLTVEGLADLPSITADAKRLQQVFSHLIQNAIKYTPDGGVICITGRRLGEGMPSRDQSIEIVVSDTGIGIAPEDLDRIFEKFYRVGDVLLHSTGKTKFKGAGPGLGLTIARGIIEAHGGRIWAESAGHDEEACLGSQFHIVMPVQLRHLESEDSAAFVASFRDELDQA
jgi:signal transduction histidine kinase